MKKIAEVLTKKPYWIIFDLETTGLAKTEHYIIQVSAVKCKYDAGKLNEVGRFNRLVNPEFLISRNITKLTGITNEMLEVSEAFEELFPEIQAYFADPDAGYAGYNVGFDIGFLEEGYKHMKADSPFESAEILDVLEYAREYLGNRTENHKLETVAKYFGVGDSVRFHQAIEDALVTEKVLQCLLDMEETR